MPTFPVETIGGGMSNVVFNPAIMTPKTLQDNQAALQGSTRLARRLARRSFATLLHSGLACLALMAGCSHSKNFHAGQGAGHQTASEFLSQISRSDPLKTECMPDYQESFGPMDIDVQTLTPEQFHGMSLQDCISFGVANSKLMRDLGVTVLRTPQVLASTVDPAVVYSDPRIGEEAALSAFDANFFASSIYDHNDRGYNNNFFGVNGLFRQDLSTTQLGVSKRSANGGLYTLRDVKVFDRNNQQSNRFPSNSSWDTFLEAQVRQPLLLGAGTEFNRIAGPGAMPGQLNGVLLARVRTDISLVDFERSVRDFVAEIENAYWDLYFAYRDLDSKIQARDQAIVTVERIEARKLGTVDKEQALEQLWRFESDVVDSLNGRVLDGTRSNNGSTGGTFRGTGGVRISERRLRLIIGMPINDRRLLYPSDQPSLAQLDFDWENSISDAMVNREELRRQRWVIKQRELELIANRNFLKPQLDAIAAYRLRGFDEQFNTPFDNDFQEWSLGLDYLMPVGYRRGHAAVRNTQLALARESQVLIEQERAVHFGLSNAINESKRAFENLVIQKSRYESVENQIEALSARVEKGQVEQVFVLLEAQRRRLDALIRYHQSAVEYQLAVRNVNLERGTLLTYCNVFLNETPSSDFIASQGIQRVGSQDTTTAPHHRDSVISTPTPSPMVSLPDAIR
jgi:hypothetical protein